MKNVCFLSLMALLCALPTTGQAHKVSGSGSKTGAPTVPPYCSPCLFYSGDLDPNNGGALGNGTTIANGNGTAAIYIPFVVPTGQEWDVRSLFINEVVTNALLDPADAVWSISAGVSAGQAGTLVVSGRGPVTMTPTGRSWSGLTEYTFQVQVREFELQPGKYWLSVLPECTNQSDQGCLLTVYSASAVEDNPPMNFKGSSPANDSFYTFKRGGDFYRPTAAGNGGVCNQGCNRFSAGATGVARKLGP
jgi:hypothetical protein